MDSGNSGDPTQPSENNVNQSVNNFVAPGTPTQPFVLPVHPQKPRWYKRKSFWIVILVIIITAVGGGLGYAYYKNSQPAPTPTAAPIAKKTAAPKAPAPTALTYYQAGTFKSCSDISPAKLYRQPLDGTAASISATLNDSQMVSYYVTDKEKVLVATSPSCASKAGAQLLLSNDGGKTYEDIFTGNSPVSGTDFDAINKPLFSNDGKTAIFGYNAAGQPQVVVKEIDLTTKKIKDLFTIGNATDPLNSSIIPIAYDHDKQLLYYYDNPDYNSLLIRDLNKNQTTELSTVDNDGATYTSYVSFNNDLTKALRTSVTSGKAGKTITIEEQSVASKKVASLGNFETGLGSDTVEGHNGVNYTGDGASVYYPNDKKIMVVGSDSKPSVLLEATAPIYAIYYVDNDRAIYVTRDSGKNSGVQLYTAKTKKTSEILAADSVSSIFGINW